MNAILFFLSLLAVSILFKPATDRLRIPFPVVLVLIGFIGSELATRLLHIDTGINWVNFKSVVFNGFLPVLIFHAAVGINIGKLQSELLTIVMLSLPLMLLSTGLIAVMVYHGIGHPGFPWIAALIAGGLLSATDPAAVISVIHKSGAPERLSLLLEGESLFNDATAIVLFSVLIALAQSGGVQELTIIDIIIRFIAVFMGGLAIGVMVALVTYYFGRLIPDRQYYSLLTVVAAYSAFLLAEIVLHLSGVMAVLAAGLLLSALERRSSNPGHLESTLPFWGVAASFSEIMIFLLAGISITLSMFTEQWLAMLIGIVAVIVTRSVIIFGGISAMNRLPGYRTVTLPQQTVLFWGGVRGTVTLALALSLPLAIGNWYTIQSIAYGVVLFTLFLQTTTMYPLVSRLKL